MSVTLLDLYKSWYITTFGVVILSAVILLTGALKTDGLIRSTSYVSLYFLYLLVTATWANYPNTTVWYAGTETIFVVVFALFYVLSRNFSPDRIIDFFVYMVPPASIVFVITYIINPEATRLGGYSMVFLPFLFLFCMLRFMQSFSSRHIVLIMICLMILVLGMSRTPLLAAVLGLLMMLITVAKRMKIVCKVTLVLVSGVVLITIIMLVFQPLTIMLAKTIARITYHDVVIGDQIIEAEMPDALRWTVFADAFTLYKTNWLFGIGYMNFMPWFGDTYNIWSETATGTEIIGTNLHNSFQTWSLEGGLPCIGIVTFLLWKYFKILSRRIKNSTNDIEKSYYNLLVIAMICLLIEGMFHQIHQTPIFFMFLGIVYALDDKHRSVRIRYFADRTRSDQCAGRTSE